MSDDLLHAHSFTKEEATALVGTQLVGVDLDFEYREIDGHRGLVVFAEQSQPSFFDRFEYLVGVQWQCREGRVSEPTRMSKEQLRETTRPLNLKEGLEAARQARQNKRTVWGQSRTGGRRR